MWAQLREYMFGKTGNPMKMLIGFNELITGTSKRTEESNGIELLLNGLGIRNNVRQYKFYSDSKCMKSGRMLKTVNDEMFNDVYFLDASVLMFQQMGKARQ